MPLLRPLVALVALAAILRVAAASAATPNVVVILADDLGQGSVGCYGAPATLVRTPHIDRLAREGRRFTDALTTSSVCSPTRYSLLTGRYCWRTSLEHEVLGVFSPLHIETDRLTLASLLAARGYDTAAIGKWHLGYGSAPRTDYTKPLEPGPLEIGFRHHFGVPANHGDLTGVYVEDHAVQGLRSDRLDPATTGTTFKDKAFLGLDAPQRVDEEVMPVLTRRAVEWIERQSSDRPFFLYYAPVAIHNPVTPSAATAGSSAAGPYGDWIHELDASVGAVLAALDRKGFAADTLVLFTSDNGGVNKPGNASESTAAIEAGLAVCGPWRGGKHDVWEGGFRVPYLVRWPGHVPAGTVCDETVSLVDTLASVAAIVGTPLPPQEEAAEDSFDVSPAWLGTAHAVPLRPDVIVHAAAGTFAIRRGTWKWIEGGCHPATKPAAQRQREDQLRPQLHDLAADAGETSDVASGHPEIVAELAGLLERYRAGGYSRTLPPVVERPAKPVVTLPPPGTKPVLADPLAAVPGSPWAVVRGRWVVREGALRGSPEPGERSPAALRAPLKLAAGDIRYELQLPVDGTHALRLQGPAADVVFRVEIGPRRLAIVRQPAEGEPRGAVVLAEAGRGGPAADWLPVRVHFRGDVLAAEVAGMAVQATHPALAGVKPAFALMAEGRGASFRNLTVTE
jgi:arylsulfatase A